MCWSCRYFFLLQKHPVHFMLMLIFILLCPMPPLLYYPTTVAGLTLLLYSALVVLRHRGLRLPNGFVLHHLVTSSRLDNARVRSPTANYPIPVFFSPVTLSSFPKPVSPPVHNSRQQIRYSTLFFCQRHMSSLSTVCVHTLHFGIAGWMVTITTPAQRRPSYNKQTN